MTVSRRVGSPSAMAPAVGSGADEPADGAAPAGPGVPATDDGAGTGAGAGAGAADGQGPVQVWDAAAAEFRDWQAGNREALNRLVHLVTPMLWHLARAYRLDQQTAEDVVQTTLVSLVRYAERIEEPQALVRWLTVTARREAWRCARAAQRVEATEDTVLDLRSGHVDGPEAHIVRSDRDQALWEAVARLTERCQRLLRTVAFCDRPNYAELSAALRMPVGSIGPTRGRCLEKLRSLLGVDTDWRTV